MSQPSFKRAVGIDHVRNNEEMNALSFLRYLDAGLPKHPVHIEMIFLSLMVNNSMETEGDVFGEELYFRGFFDFGGVCGSGKDGIVRL